MVIGNNSFLYYLSKQIRKNMKNTNFAGLDACSSIPCQKGGTCFASMGGNYTCNCHFTAQGKNCEQSKMDVLRKKSRHYNVFK